MTDYDEMSDFPSAELAAGLDFVNKYKIGARGIAQGMQSYLDPRPVLQIYEKQWELMLAEARKRYAQALHDLAHSINRHGFRRALHLPFGKHPRKRRSGGRLVSRNERLARIRNRHDQLQVGRRNVRPTL